MRRSHETNAVWYFASFDAYEKSTMKVESAMCFEQVKRCIFLKQKKIRGHLKKKKKKKVRVRWTSTLADLHTLKTTNHNFPSFHTVPSLPPINKQSSKLRKFGGCTLATGGEILVTK